MDEIVELIHLIVSDLELLELGGPGQHGQDVGLIHDGLHHLVEDLDGVVLDVEVGGRSAEVGGVQVPGSLVETDHLGPVELSGRLDDDVAAFRLQGRVLFHLLSQLNPFIIITEFTTQ